MKGKVKKGTEEDAYGKTENDNGSVFHTVHTLARLVRSFKGSFGKLRTEHGTENRIMM
jgi:hypothetical protein